MLAVQLPRPRNAFGLLEAEPWRDLPPLGDRARQRLALLAARTGRLAAPYAVDADVDWPPPASQAGAARRNPPLAWRPPLAPTLAGLTPSTHAAAGTLAELVVQALPNETLVHLLRCAVAGGCVPRSLAQGRVVAAELLQRVRRTCRRQAAVPAGAPAAVRARGRGVNGLLDCAQREAFQAAHGLDGGVRARARAGDCAREALGQLERTDGGMPQDFTSLLGAVRALAYLEGGSDDGLAAAATQALDLLCLAPHLAPFVLKRADTKDLAEQVQLLRAEGALVGGVSSAVAQLAGLKGCGGPHLQVWLRGGGPAAWSMVALARGEGCLLGALAELSSRAEVGIAVAEWLTAAAEAVARAHAAGALPDGVREAAARAVAACRGAGLDPDGAQALQAARRLEEAVL